YVLWTAPYPSPFWRRYAWHVPGPLDVAAMRVAARQLVGQRDFAAFQGSGRRARSTVRRLYRLDVLPAGARLSIVAEADGFLHKMVRNLVGTLVDVGRGRFSPADVAAILASGDRRRAGPTAPGHGLCLERVWYAPDSGAPAFLTAGCPKP
ncbi:MAG: tRNA pseudouridine(38-40) synthase TruA, partial [Clostridia bacterium]|nr:tRNA pseudouridine(38-40) synthase TruA [Clostridia bacterium]